MMVVCGLLSTSFSKSGVACRACPECNRRVYTDSFYPKGVAAAAYIGRYMGHPPLAMSHLTHYNGRQVRFWYQETATGLRRDVALSALDFISLIVKHIPPKGMQLMRHAGLYARNTKAKWAQKVRTALDGG
jgi:hypothetical protein